MKKKLKKIKKPPSRRSRCKYPALDAQFNLRSRTELFEMDYLDKLSEKDKEWLNKFNNEYINDVLDRDNLKNNLHNTQTLKKDCDDRNNSRNRCILTRQKAAGDHIYIEEIKNTDEESLFNVTVDFHDSSDESDNNSDPTEDL